MRHGLQGYAGQRPTRPSDRRPGRPVVAVVGAGAAGTLTAIHLVDRASRDRRALDIVLLDPRPDTGRGVAYSTTDQRHLLNVPAGGMSALPGRAGPLGRLAARRTVDSDAGPADFVPRAEYGRYLDETLAALVDAAPDVACEHRCQRVTSARPCPAACTSSSPADPAGSRRRGARAGHLRARHRVGARRAARLRPVRRRPLGAGCARRPRPRPTATCCSSAPGSPWSTSP